MTTNTRKSLSELKRWYELVSDYTHGTLTPAKFCKAKGLKLKEFSNWLYRFVIWNKKNIHEKENEIALGEKCLFNRIKPVDFAIHNNIDIKRLNKILTFLNYMKRLNLDPRTVFEKPNITQINLIELNNTNQHEPIVNRELTIHEVIEPENELELIIAKGVKVTVSPEINNEKLINIIEFMRKL